jgi:hypothetical protein
MISHENNSVIVVPLTVQFNHERHIVKIYAGIELTELQEVFRAIFPQLTGNNPTSRNRKVYRAIGKNWPNKSPIFLIFA